MSTKVARKTSVQRGDSLVGSGRMVSRKALVHGIAHCPTCGWQCEDYLVVQKRAADHARRKGHKVNADLGYFVEYGG